MPPKPTALGRFAAAWGLAGVAFLLGRAIWRLWPATAQAFTAGGLGAGHLAAGAAWIGFMAYGEGYRGFQRAFAPRAVARALHLAAEPRPLRVALAPLFLMALFDASRRRMITSWLLLCGIILLIVAVRRLPQPTRGLIDAGVVVGLAWGLAALLVVTARALAGKPPGVPADVAGA